MNDYDLYLKIFLTKKFLKNIKKSAPGKYLAIFIRWIPIIFDADFSLSATSANKFRDFLTFIGWPIMVTKVG